MSDSPARPADPLSLGAALNLAGASMGAQLYTCFVLTNTVADASAQGLYDAETCLILLAEQQALLRAVRIAGRALRALPALPEVDQLFLTQADGAIDGLLDLMEAVRLVASSVRGEPDATAAQERFGRLRVEALQRVRRILAPG